MCHIYLISELKTDKTMELGDGGGGTGFSNRN